MTRVRAAVLREFGEPLVIEDVDLRDPLPEEVRVEIDAVAICHSDITYIDGGWGGPLPSVYGHEAAGRGGRDRGTRARRGSRRSRGRHSHSIVRRMPGLPTRAASRLLVKARSRFTDRRCQRRNCRPGDVLRAFAEQVGRSPFTTRPHRSRRQAGEPSRLRRDHRNRGSSSIGPRGAWRSGRGDRLRWCRTERRPRCANRRCRGDRAVDPDSSKLEAALTFGATTASIQHRTTQWHSSEMPVRATSPMQCSWQPVRQAPTEARRTSSESEVRSWRSACRPTNYRSAGDPGSLAAADQRIIGSKMGSAHPRRDIGELVELHRAGKLMLDELISAT